ncbi:MAG: hypothetical protein A2309_02760 [Bacteroidetes bacterium RIFOXYB2_FULL_35_7]|nr:MAG: hypothetical protein A2X01_08375 [Bacteroidetes bacterium GWF2_35_48]OFY93447.1 MAG: hypothetical protein A2309_02760 [Bacteroidetes bacterium RIFOXYB2_FULL_35_7]HBX50843.1 hypothetical protein [Bacteroidales bacterium]
MIDFAKFILVRMSFDENLFKKELRKFIIWLKDENTDELKDWCIQNYSGLIKNETNQLFSTNMNN